MQTVPQHTDSLLYICITVKTTLLIYYRRYNCYCHMLHSVHVSCAYLVTLISVDLQQLKRKSDGINMVGTACTCTQYLSSTVYCVIEIHINNTPDATYTHTVLLQCYKVARFVTLQQRSKSLGTMHACQYRATLL